ncbi:OmpA family protein [Neolewinella xylanilytica]|uniref:OmpA family protein n=1 Tax=Neolewinella xylanilytica TaxID=1514080 RepID=A0A2S6I592_9BACT|nr:OmpA family protein [Neolewinella xylanilytica]PPK86299.1 OmpA family protein [Neolewinella xylanilytica]
MNFLRSSITGLLLCLCGATFAQGTPLSDADTTYTVESTSQTIEMKRDQPTMLELGISPYASTMSSDVDAKFGYGVGIHARKSLDHLFSLRLDALYAKSKGDAEFDAGDGNRRFEADWIGGTAFGVVTLNNFLLKGDTRNWNVFLMAGAGFNFVSTEFQCNDEASRFGCSGDNQTWQEGRNGMIDSEFRTNAAAGGGVSYRINEKINIGLEYQALIPLGNRADLMDGYSASTFRDVLNVFGLAVNFNIGNSSTRAEPRYWTNAFSPLKEDISNLNRRVDAATTDSDGDGIVDSVDQEPDTPADVPVDSRGRTLDSDKDGVPDYRDLEPFFPPREGEQINADGVVIERMDRGLTEDEVTSIVDDRIERVIERDGIMNATTMVNSPNGAIYLPMLYFPLNASEIAYDDYGMLASVARVLQANPAMRVIVRGYTDRVGNPEFNQKLSYMRAYNVIRHLVSEHNIGRERLILQYRGEDEAIVPLDRSRTNRRVEFLTGQGDATEDPAPEGVDVPEIQNNMMDGDGN